MSVREKLRIKEADARRALAAAGVTGVDDWNSKKLHQRLQTLVEMEGVLQECSRQEDQVIIEALLDASTNGDEVELELTPAQNGEGKTRKAGKRASPPEGGKADKANKFDQFGCRLGSRTAAINAALSKRPKSVDRIAEETGQDATFVRQHLRYWVRRGASVTSGHRIVADEHGNFYTEDLQA